MKLTLIIASMFLACSLHAGETNAELQTEIVALQKEIVGLQKVVAALQANKALALAPFVTVDPNPENGVRGPHITFSGANIHVVSGTGATNDNGTLSGLGNLIVGYDENPPVLANPQYRNGRTT
jgi:hypothetical protein